MSYRKHLLLAAVLLVFVAVVPSISFAQEGEGAPRSGIRPDAPMYGVRGAYLAGTQDAVIDGDSPLNMTIWYPADIASGTETAITYAYATNPDTFAEMQPTVTGLAIRDASFDLSAAPYPLVVFSHGFSLGHAGYAWLAEHLATHGFVVIAPQHYELVDETLGDFWRAAITRPQEIVQVLDYVDAEIAEGGTLAGLVNPELTQRLLGIHMADTHHWRWLVHAWTWTA